MANMLGQNLGPDSLNLLSSKESLQLTLVPRKSHEHVQVGLKRRAAALHDRRGPLVARSYDDIMKRSIVNHAKQLPLASAFFTLPPPTDSAMYSLQTLTASGGLKRTRLSTSDFVAADDEDANGDDLTSEHVLAFRVLHAAPHMLKIVPGPVAAGPIFHPDSFSIAVHPVLDVLDACPIIHLSCTARPQVLAGLLEMPVAVLRNELKVWTLSADMQYTLPATEGGIAIADMRAAVTMLVSASAVPGQQHVQFSACHHFAFQQLLAQGFLQQSPEGLQLTQEAMLMLITGGVLAAGEKVCKIRATDYGACSLMELLLHLEDKGLTHLSDS
eukprot:6490377-Amphidinium_carterae.2